MKTKHIEIGLVDTSTGEVIVENRKVLGFGYGTNFQGEKHLERWIKCYIRGLEKYPNLSMSINCRDFQVPMVQSLF